MHDTRTRTLQIFWGSEDVIHKLGQVVLLMDGLSLDPKSFQAEETKGDPEIEDGGILPDNSASQ